jgi:hypothetical protein
LGDGVTDLRAALLVQIARAAVRRHDVKAAKRASSPLLEHAKAVELVNARDRKSWMPSAAALLAFTGEVDEALEMIKQIDDPPTRTLALALAAREAARAGELANAKRFAELAYKLARILPNRESLIGYQPLTYAAWALASVGQTANALNAVTLIEDENSRNLALLLAVTVRAEAGDMKGAKLLTESIVANARAEPIAPRPTPDVGNRPASE